MSRPATHPLLLMLLLLLAACGGSPPTTAGTAEQASGEIMFPPAAGTVTFQATDGTALFDVVSFPVEVSGRYQIQLPAPAQLSAAGKVNLLPMLPDPSLLNLKAATCTSQPQTSNALARLAVMTGGTFRQGTQLTGQLVSAPQAVGGFTTLELVTTQRQYAYADRDVSITGTLNCTFTAQDGSTQPGTVTVDYQLKQGWNTLTQRVVQQSRLGPISITTSAQGDLSGVQWRYLPLIP